MLKHLRHRLSRQLFTLFMLVALAGLSSGHVQRQAAANNGNSQAASSARAGFDCVRAVDESGNCVIICCDSSGCYGTPCP
ncbi:MAG TPA: hypothetical protein VNO50_04780 [Pyrinomonadaceae bacterium]|nr:hypothetical protein [Pyrinomonadaceae bacterium]